MKDNRKPLISICIPVFNEGENVILLHQELNKVTERFRGRYEFEFIFSDNKSEDDTWNKIQAISHVDTRVKAIRFTRNIGFQDSIMANLSYASGVAMVQIDADLQDPPELIIDFINNWEGGYKVIYGVRQERREHLLLNLIRKIGYRFISAISEHPIPRDAGDFRLLDRVVVDTLVKSNTPKPYIRGAIAGYGYNSLGIPYARRERIANESKFPMHKVFKLGLDGVINHSSWPLRFSSLSGIFILLCSLSLSVYYVFLKLNNQDLPQGLASIHILVTFGIGMNALFLGIIGNYLNRIYLILRDEPKFIVSDEINFGGK
jgi:glycosyltransferase involved in cell wall biosynthesis